MNKKLIIVKKLNKIFSKKLKKLNCVFNQRLAQSTNIILTYSVCHFIILVNTTHVISPQNASQNALLYLPFVLFAFIIFLYNFVSNFDVWHYFKNVFFHLNVIKTRIYSSQLFYNGDKLSVSL